MVSLLLAVQIEPIAETPYQPSSPGPSGPRAPGGGNGGGNGRRRWVSIVFLWVPACILIAAGMLAPFGTLRAQGATLATAGLVSLVVVPILPLLWHAFAERGRKQRGDGHSFRRLGMRACGVALIVLSTSVVSVGSRTLTQSVASATGFDFITRGDLFSGIPLLGTRELLSYVPENASGVVVLDFNRLKLGQLVEMGKTASAGSAAAAAAGVQSDVLKNLETMCGIAWRDAKFVAATAPGGKFMAALQQKTLAADGKLTCAAQQILGKLGWQGDLVVDRKAEPWTVKLPDAIASAVSVYLDDEGTLVFVSPAWNEVMRLQIPNKGRTPASGPLGHAIDRVDRSSGMWLAATTAADSDGQRSIAASMDVEATGVRLRGTVAVPGKAGAPSPLAEFEARVPMAAVEDAIKQALTKGLTGGLPGGLSRFIPGP